MTLKVAILLGCFNGANYLREQLDSIEAQAHTDWCLYASDDGSTDGTVDILREYQQRWGSSKLVIFQGPQKGFSINFLGMACNSQIVANFYAFCDQDDVWLPDKLAVAVEYLRNQDSSIPQAYGGRTIYTDNNLKERGRSRKFHCFPSFNNAIMQSIAGGNTIVFNQKARELLALIGPVEVVSHDWWLYIVVEGVGGRFYFDTQPYIFYRQHNQAMVGQNITFTSKLRRFLQLIRGDYKKWNDQHIHAISKVSHLLKPQNRIVFEAYVRLRESSLSDRVKMLNVCRLYRHERFGGIILFIAAVLKKL